MAGCKFGRRVNMFHAECKSSGGDCLYCRPDAVRCKAEYLEGPNITGKEHYYTVIFEEYEQYPDVWIKQKFKLWADNPKECIKFIKTYTASKVRNIRVLPLIKVLDNYTISTDNKNHHSIKYNNKVVITGRFTAFSNSNKKNYFKLPEGIKSITGIALTETSILVQFLNNGKLEQRSLPITEELKELF